MMRTAAGVLLVLGILGALGTVAIMGITGAAKWALGRESARTAADTFAEDFIPEAADVAARQEQIDEDAMCAQLDAIADTLRQAGVLS
jgi:hypothetical protein